MVHPRLTDEHFRRAAAGLRGIRVVNPGSVGQPTEEDLCAGWAVVDGDVIDRRRVAYDRDEVIRQTEAMGHPAAASIVAHLRGEKIDRGAVRDDFDMLELEPPLEAKRA